jgi:hypothetical protein
MRATQVLAIIIDKMADVGDFEIEPGFLKDPEAFREKVEADKPDPIDKAYRQGKKSALRMQVTAEMNPYPLDTEEFKAWGRGFSEVRQ